MMRTQNRWGVVLLTLPRPVKRYLVLALDALLCLLAISMAFYLSLDQLVPMTGPAMWAAFLSVVLALSIFVMSGLYRTIFRYNGLPAMVALVRAMLLYGVLFAVIFTLYQVPGVPRSVGLLQPILLLILVVASRAAARMWLGGVYSPQRREASLPQALIYGAGSAGRQLASAMANSPEIRVVGFLDDDNRLHGHVLNGLPIYNPADLAELISDTAITDVLLALPSVSRQRRSEIINTIKPNMVTVRTMPGLSDIATGKVSLSDVRDLDIDDLLGREPVKPNGLLLSLNTTNKTVLVTGAGGSIGSELCRQILRTQPKQLLLVDMSEFALYQIHLELAELLAEDLFNKQSRQAKTKGEPIFDHDSALKIAEVEVVPLLASVCDEVRMQEIMDTWKPHTVYHAAAYKHVPMVEHNPAEGVRNNVWGTLVCAEAALRNGVCNFVLISTDKAVRPTNIMGATKRLAEMVLQAMAVTQGSPGQAQDHGTSVAACVVSQSAQSTTFSMVRFGNVLGSSGSVVPLFREQIKSGGPITLTHSDITRYFMTISEAAQLVIQAGAMAQGGDMFVLHMGQPVKIIDLAKRMVELSGLTVRDEVNPNGDIEIQVTGLRPGEKLYEELLICNNPLLTSHSRIMKAHEDFLPWGELQANLAGLKQALDVNDVPLIRTLLKDLVPGYQPQGDVVDLVWMAKENNNKVNCG